MSPNSRHRSASGTGFLQGHTVAARMGNAPGLLRIFPKQELKPPWHRFNQSGLRIFDRISLADFVLPWHEAPEGWIPNTRGWTKEEPIYAFRKRGDPTIVSSAVWRVCDTVQAWHLSRCGPYHTQFWAAPQNSYGRSGRGHTRDRILWILVRVSARCFFCEISLQGHTGTLYFHIRATTLLFSPFEIQNDTLTQV